MKAQAAERENWNCDKFSAEKVRMLQEDLQNALGQIDELKDRNRELEAKVLMAGNEKRDTMLTHPEVTKCRMVGDSILCIAGVEHAEMIVKCFPGIKTEQLHRVVEQKEVGNPETVIIDVGADDMRATRNLDLVMGEIYTLVSTAKKKLPNCRLLLSRVLRRRDVSWRLTVTLKLILRRLEWKRRVNSGTQALINNLVWENGYSQVIDGPIQGDDYWMFACFDPRAQSPLAV